MIPICIDLRKQFGNEYRISWDPSYDPKGKHRDNLDPWYARIPCRRGIFIYPHGGNRLGVVCDYHPGLLKQLLALPRIEIHQQGDQEATLLFDLGEFDAVAQIVKPRKRRRLSEVQKQACKERLAKVRPKLPTPRQNSAPETVPQPFGRG